MWDSEDIISGLGMLILGWGYTGRWEPMVLVLVGVVGLVIEWLSPFYRRYRTPCRKA
jgi:preprotein translocase subunit Sss1